MNYKECLEYIDDVTKKYGISPGLDNMNIMLDYTFQNYINLVLEKLFRILKHIQGCTFL